MKTLFLLVAAILGVLLSSTWTRAEVVYVSSQQEFTAAHDGSSANDSIVWKSGTYSGIYLEIEKDQLFIGAENLGSTVFTGSSRVEIRGNNIVFKGFQFLDGNIGPRDVINVRGSQVEITQINIRAYTCYKYLRVREESQYVTITYCNFENRLNLDDQNILSILVNETNPGYHKIQYCSFKNFAGTGNDLGIEPIRIGLSTQADHISRSLVEYCYFTQCNGDGEIISSKASQNVYRFNTFEDNPKAELVLRHGSEAIVYGNFFLKGKGGVRVREGQNHYLYNNYFSDLADRAIYLQNEGSDPLDNINIAFNTVVASAEVILGGNGSNKPTNVTFANNIFSAPQDDVFEEPTGTESWIGNIVFGNLGIPPPANGITIVDPQLEENGASFFGLAQSSPAVNAAQPAYAFLPQFEGMDDIDTEILFDLMGQNRPASIEERDVGANEYPHAILIQPIATEENTGPSYNTSSITSTVNITRASMNFMKISPNPVANQLAITIDSQDAVNLRVAIFNLVGKEVLTITDTTISPGRTTFSKNIEDLPAGGYVIRAIKRNELKGVETIQASKFVKSR